MRRNILPFTRRTTGGSRPKLTLNLGLRWDLQPGPTERYNRLAGYDFTKVNSFGQQGRIDFPGTQGYSRNLWDTEYHDFQPRVGAAYQFNSGLVVARWFRHHLSAQQYRILLQPQ